MLTLIRNVFIVDGSLRKPYKADVLISKNHVLSIGEISERENYLVVEGEGRYLSPGFIDVEYQGLESFILQDREQRHYLENGITTLVVGHRGKSLAPIFKKELEILGASLNRNWGSFRDFRETIKNNKYGLNFVSLVGDFNIRSSFGSLYKGGMTAIDKNSFLSVLYNSLASGALGLSSNMGGGFDTHLDDLKKNTQFTLGHKRMVSVSFSNLDFNKRKEILLILLREKRKINRGLVFISDINLEDISYLKRSRALNEILASFTPVSKTDFITLFENNNLFPTNKGGQGEIFKEIIKMGLKRQEGLSIEKVINKITQKPALSMGVFDSYEIRSGFRADLVLFDSLANINEVFVAGERVKNGNLSNNLAGKFYYVA